jgi:hypothetical protein
MEQKMMCVGKHTTTYAAFLQQQPQSAKINCYDLTELIPSDINYPTTDLVI